MRKSVDIDKIIKKMTLDEKVGQMLQLPTSFFSDEENGAITGPMADLNIDANTVFQCGSVLGITDPEQMIKIQSKYLENSHNKIPLIFMTDVIHGFRTIFPIPLALGCSWDMDLVQKTAEVAGKESALSGIQVTFSPMADLVRDPRWGRVMESTGEDAWLNGQYAKAFVKGYQENEESEYRISACIKHFAAYGAAEGGREYNTVDISEWMLREYYLPAYRAAIDAGCDMLMASFNILNGIPAAANVYLMKEILRREWKYEGITISDWGAVGELITHGVAVNEKEAALLAIKAGMDIEMSTATYAKHCEELIREGSISEKDIDDSVSRILKLKENRGLFENPYGMADKQRLNEVCLCDSHRAIAKEAAEKSAVLLKNKGILPLSTGQNIVLVGPFVSEKSILGNWRATGEEKDTISLWEGMLGFVPENQLQFIEGCSISGDAIISKDELAMRCSNADVLVLALGEGQDMSGEARSRTTIGLPGRQAELLEMAKKTGKPIVVILFNGRPLEIEQWENQADAIVEMWFPGTEGGNAAAGILFGYYNPSGRLTMSFPRSVGHIPVYYNEFASGRPITEDSKPMDYISGYTDSKNSPLYPFGFGLSYTTFTYSDIRLNSTVLNRDAIHASITIKNVGQYAGKETVQLYLRDLKGCVVRPLLELKGYEQVYLEPQEEKEITFIIDEDMLRFHNTKGERILESGEYAIMIGCNSTQGKKASFNFEHN